jgi:hypothetical protein
METLLVWTLIIAAMAIVSMLLLLIASEREARRQWFEAESLRAKLESPGTAFEGPTSSADEGTGIGTEVTRLTEQVHANEVAIATMQCELEALRAENHWLKRECAAFQAKSPGPDTHVTEPIPMPQIKQTARSSDYSLDAGPRRSRLTIPATAVALLLVALVGLYLAGDRTTLPPARQAESRAKAQSAGNPAPVSTSTTAADSKELKIAPELTPKASALKRRVGVPAAGTSYEVVRSTRVFSEPNESSRPLARIEAGMEINVVGARDDWLEVRSRHGRPPGFIRKDTAIIKGLR